MSQITDPQDDRDKRIHDDFMGLYMLSEMSRKWVEFHTDKDTSDKVYEHWFNAGICLLKASAHARNFERLLGIKRKEFQKTIKVKNSTDQQKYYWDLTVEVEGMLTQLKAALDSYARVIALIHSLKGVRGWSKKKSVGESKIYSGQNIINSLLRNLDAKKLKKAQNLVDCLNDNKEQLTKIVDVRDGFTHPQNLFMESVSGFYYERSTKKVIEPALAFDGKGILQSSFVTQGFEFILEVLTISGQLLLDSIGSGMVIRKKDGKYEWFMTKDMKIKKPKK